MITEHVPDFKTNQYINYTSLMLAHADTAKPANTLARQDHHHHHGSRRSWRPQLLSSHAQVAGAQDKAKLGAVQTCLQQKTMCWYSIVEQTFQLHLLYNRSVTKYAIRITLSFMEPANFWQKALPCTQGHQQHNSNKHTCVCDILCTISKLKIDSWCASKSSPSSIDKVRIPWTVS